MKIGMIICCVYIFASIGIYSKCLMYGCRKTSIMYCGWLPLIVVFLGLKHSKQGRILFNRDMSLILQVLAERQMRFVEVVKHFSVVELYWLEKRRFLM